ncbi:MAG: S24 family peptidase [Rubrivivax sp.]|nr:S24 family peptidase [Rubrivivax sp.]MDP3084892.1 S24 family peptidase [Rubrivivax sp.]
MSCACKTPPAPAAESHDSGAAGCSGGESFALQVLGDDMLPEFRHGEIIIVEPDGALRDGSFVLAQPGGEWTLRQLVRRGADGWALRALNPGGGEPPELALPDLSAVHGVVIQKSVPGRRRLTKFYS